MTLILGTTQLFILVFAFGICASTSYAWGKKDGIKIGFQQGCNHTISILYQAKIVSVVNGIVTRFRRQQKNISNKVAKTPK